MEKRIFNKQIFKRTMLLNVIDQKNAETDLHSKEIVAIIRELILELDEIADRTYNRAQRKPTKGDELSKKDILLKIIYKELMASLTQDPFPLDAWITVNPVHALSLHEKTNAEEEWQRNQSDSKSRSRVRTNRPKSLTKNY